MSPGVGLVTAGVVAAAEGVVGYGVGVTGPSGPQRPAEVVAELRLKTQDVSQVTC